MPAQQIAQRCAEETGVARMSQHGEEVALIAIATASPDLRGWKRQVRSEFRARHPEYGSILLMILIPVIVNLVTAWLAKWIFSEHPTSLELMRMDAQSALKS
jgi:hypothetical protein